MAKEAPSSPIKAKTSAFLNRLKRVKSGPLGPSELAGGPRDAGPGASPFEAVDGANVGVLADIERRSAIISMSESRLPAPDRPGYDATGLSAVTISTSPFLPSSSAFGEAPATPLSVSSGTLRVETAGGATIDPAGISLPLPSPTEDEALSLTDVIELQAFVEKKRWIQQQIDVLRGLETVDCFAGCRSTFADGRDDADSTLPTPEAVEVMFQQHEQIEAEAEKLDIGEIARLRQMARAASAKSLSRTDTDLLEITLSTLFLLDTLLHLLRDRGDTLDLLALRLDWDSRRASIALDVGAIERDVKLFVEQRGRWSIDAYRQPPPANLDEPDADGVGRVTRAVRRGSDASIRSMSSARSFGPGAGTATRSQRFLMTQIMELDCQSFQNRISSLRGGPVAQAGRLLDRMIDVAASIRARNRKRAAHERSLAASADDPSEADAAQQASQTPTTDESEGGALPDWFLDEMDAVELKVDQLRAWDDLARAHSRQWKAADQVFHSLRKTQVDAELLVSDIMQAALQHPSVERASGFDAKATQLLSALSSTSDIVSDRSALAISPGLFAATSPALLGEPNAIVECLAAEVKATQQATATIQEQTAGYRQLASRVKILDSLHLQMTALAQELDSALSSLSCEPTAGRSDDVPDLSTIACLRPETHEAFLASLGDLAVAVPAAIQRSKPLLKEASLLLLAVKASGMDPNLRSAVLASSSRLQDVALAAEAALASAQDAAASLDAYRSISAAQDDASAAAGRLQLSLLAALDRERWRQPPLPLGDAGPDQDWRGQLAALASDFESRVSEPLASLDVAARTAHPAIASYLVERTDHLRSALTALPELAMRLLPAVGDQRRVVERLSAQGSQLREACAAATADASPSELARLESETEAFLAALPRDVPLVSSPALANALAIDASLPPSGCAVLPDQPPAAVNTPAGTTNMAQAVPVVDLVRLDASVRAHLNSLAAKLVRERELLREAHNVSQASSFDTAVEAVDAELSAVLDLIDAVGDMNKVTGPYTAPRDELDDGLQRLTAALDKVVAAAASHPDQTRALSETSRLQRATAEMTEMAATALHPSRACSRSTSVASSLASEAGSSEADHDGQTSFHSETTASIGRTVRPASAAHAHVTASASSPTASAERPGDPIAPDVKTPTKVPTLAPLSRARLPTSFGPARVQSPRSVSGPARSPLPGSQPSRLPAGSPRGPSRPRAVSSAAPDGTAATPSRLRLSSQPSDFLSPTALRSPPAGSSSSALPRALRYGSPGTRPAAGAQAVGSERRLRPRASGDANRTRERIVSDETADDAPGLATPIRRRSSSAARAPRTPLSRRPYVPQKGHKLDRAVSKIVNAMPVEIPIVAAHEGSDAEAGRYWIGEPPKLCYCRILRSRTVMVRVGGGWVELSKFLRDHFKDIIPSSSPSTVLSPADPGKGERWLSGGGGGGPATPSRAPGSRVVSQPLAQTLFPIVDSPAVPHVGVDRPLPATPDREDQSLRRARKVSGAPTTPTFATPRTMTVLVSSPGPESPSAPAAGPGSPASPMVPLQLMRKANDGERSNPSSLGVAAGTIGLGLPSTGQAARSIPRTTSGASVTSSRSRPSIPWRF